MLSQNRVEPQNVNNIGNFTTFFKICLQDYFQTLQLACEKRDRTYPEYGILNWTGKKIVKF